MSSSMNRGSHDINRKPSQPHQITGEYLNRSEARSFVRLSDSHWDAIQDPKSDYFDSTFPSAFRLTARIRLWKRDDLIAWIESRREELPSSEQKHQKGALVQ